VSTIFETSTAKIKVKKITHNGMKWESPSVCIDEFKNGKIANLRTYFDRLAQSQQVAKGMFAKWGVNAVVNRAQKGLQ